MATQVFNNGLLESWYTSFVVMTERQYAKRWIKRLLKSYRAVERKGLDLTGKHLYREVLLHTRQVEPSRVDHILWQAEKSVDGWTAPGRDDLGFRELVHFMLHSRYRRKGSVISFSGLVNSLVPAHL